MTLRMCLRERRRKEQQKQERTGLKALSSLGLTPGTSLMALIQQSLAFYICRRLESERWQHVQWELSGANVQVGPFPGFEPNSVHQALEIVGPCEAQ